MPFRAEATSDIGTVFDPDVYLSGLAAAMGMAIAAWLISLPLRDVSIIDSLWPLFFLLMAVDYLAQAPAIGGRSLLSLFLVTLWGTRLCVFVTLRNRNRGEDRRYQVLRQAHSPGFDVASLYLVFGLQAVLAWMMSLSLHAAILGTAPLNWLDTAGTALCLGGIFCEAIADSQLARFLSDPANRDQVLDRGLWRYTRHPNYFGEASFWWGIYLLALGAGAWWSLPAPVLVQLLLLRLGGIALVERDIAQRRPAYPDYARRTNAFWPGPPRQPASYPT